MSSSSTRWPARRRKLALEGDKGVILANHVYIEDIAAHVGEEVTLKGWLYNKTDKGRLHFLPVRDGTGIIQGVVSEKDMPPDVFEAAKSLTHESSIIVTSAVRSDRPAHGRRASRSIRKYERYV